VSIQVQIHRKKTLIPVPPSKKRLADMAPDAFRRSCILLKRFMAFEVVSTSYAIAADEDVPADKDVPPALCPCVMSSVGAVASSSSCVVLCSSELISCTLFWLSAARADSGVLKELLVLDVAAFGEVPLLRS
jgi:hypothetical protein